MTQNSVNASSITDMLASVNTEKVYVLTENDTAIIEQLKLLQGNRKIKPEKIKDLIEFIKSGGFMPIIYIALPSLSTTEGNHRITACLECIKLGIPFELRVYFYKDANPLETARVMNNNMTPWRPEDYLGMYCFQKNANYLLLKEWLGKNEKYFKRKTQYQIKAAVELFYGTCNTNAFNEGEFKLTTDVITNAEVTYAELKAIAEIIGTNSCFGRSHIPGWQAARERLGISFSQFTKKLAKAVKEDKWKDPKDTKKDWTMAYIAVAVS